jgi:hypothetical protein
MHQKVNEAVKITILIFQLVITILHDVQDIFQLSTQAAKEQVLFSLSPLCAICQKTQKRRVCHFPNASPSVHKALSALSIHFYCIKKCRRRKAKL